MNISKFISVTTWASILLIIFGVLTGVFQNNFTTWFCFVFLVAAGIGEVAINFPSRKS